MQEWDAIDQIELNIWMEDFVNVVCHDGASYLDLYQRILDFHNSIIRINQEQIYIIAHGGTIRTFLALIEKVPLVDSFKIIKVQIGSIRVVENFLH